MNQESQNRVQLDRMYQDIIREHHKEPRNFKKLEDFDLSEEGYNPLCGDRVSIQLKLNEQKTTIVETGFQGEGCSICMASASILAEEVEKESIEATKERIELFRDVMQDKKDPSEVDGDLEALTGVRNFPVRIKCALLPWTTLKSALEGKKSEKVNRRSN